MEKYKLMIDQALAQFKSIEESVSSLFAQIPGIGTIAGDHSNLILLAIMAGITIVIIKPLVKWSIMIVVGATLTAAVISHFSGLTFWGVLPLTAVGVSTVMFSNKFSMG